jgi:hypothetical protein
MKKSTLVLFGSFAVLAACSSLKPDYTITDASHSSRPDWIQPEYVKESDSSANRKEYRYYVDSSENINQRLCLKSAEARATQKVAAEIAQEIVSHYEERVLSNNETAQEQLSENLAQNLQVILHGIRFQNQYWEKRVYKQELGALKDYATYKCDVVVKIKKTEIIQALETYKTLTVRKMTGKEKANLAEAVNDTIRNLKEQEEK